MSALKKYAIVVQGRLQRLREQRYNLQMAYGDDRGAFYETSMEQDLKALVDLALAEKEVCHSAYRC